jgi:hypothetical protein
MRNSNGFEFYPGRRLPVVCRDGVIRSAVITGQPDTFFSIPAAVQITAGGKRRTVSGSLYHDIDGKVSFGAYRYRANHIFIPLTRHRPRLAKLARQLISATAYGPLSKGLPSNHAAALADVCRIETAGLTEPAGQHESPGWIACRLLRRLRCEDLCRLAAFFDRLGRFQFAAGE